MIQHGRRRKGLENVFFFSFGGQYRNLLTSENEVKQQLYILTNETLENIVMQFITSKQLGDWGGGMGGKTIRTTVKNRHNPSKKNNPSGIFFFFKAW